MAPVSAKYETGKTRITRKFIWGFKRLEGYAVWGFRFKNVQQKLVITYKKRSAGDFGEVAPTPLKIWQDIRFCL